MTKWSDFWFHLKFACARERVHIETARRAQAALTEAASWIEAAAHTRRINPPPLVATCRLLASRLFTHYGPERRGSRLFIVAKRRGRLHSVAEAAASIRVAIDDELANDQELL